MLCPVVYIYWTLLIPGVWDHLINTARRKLGTTVCETEPACLSSRAEPSGVSVTPRSANARKLNRTETICPQRVPWRCGGAARVRGNGSESGKTPTVFRIRGDDKELLDWSMRPEKSGILEFTCARCIRKHHPKRTSQDTECDLM